MRRLYLTLAILGLVVPYAFCGWFIATHGLDLGLFARQAFGTRGALFFVADLLITALVFLVFSFREAQRVKMRRWWPYAVATLLVGPSFSVPWFLYVREKRFAPTGEETIGLGVQIKVK